MGLFISKSSKSVIQNSVRDGWVAFQVRPWPIVLMMAGLAAVWIAVQTVVGLVFGDKSWPSSLVGVIFQFSFMVFYPGLQAYLLKAVRKEVPDWRDFFWGWNCPVRVFSADILSTIPPFLALVVGGLALWLVNTLDVPDSTLFFKYITLGVMGASLVWVVGYLVIGLNQWSLLLIDKNRTAFQSVKQSWELMRGHQVDFALLWVIVALINCLGMLALLVGVLVSFPVSLGIFAAFYVRISDALNSKES